MAKVHGTGQRRAALIQSRRRLYGYGINPRSVRQPLPEPFYYADPQTQIGIGNYESSGREPEVLIARRLYSDLGADPTCGVNQTYRSDVTFAGVKGQCMTADQYAECKSTGKVFGQPCTVSSGGFLSSIGSGIKSIFGGALNVYGSAKTAEGQSAAYQQMLAAQRSQTPSWVMPVVIGGAGIAAVLLITRARKKR